MQSIRRIASIGLILLSAVSFVGASPATVRARPFTGWQEVPIERLPQSGPASGEPDAGSTRTVVYRQPSPEDRTGMQKRWGLSEAVDYFYWSGRFWMSRILRMGL